MELWSFAVIGVLAAAVLVLALRQLSLRRSLREIVQTLEDTTASDTNALITVSTGDRAVRALAARLNVQLRALRRERLKLQHGDRELKNAVTNISHDLRTPLTAICGYLDLLEGESLPPQTRQYLCVIRERAEALRVLSEELLRYCVVASTADALEPTPLRLNDAVEQSLAAFYGVLSGRGITPEIHIPEAAVVRTLDAAALRRILGNILANAAKYSVGDLRVCLTADGTVSFENTAPQLDAVQVQRLFDRFYTLETAAGSTGLGLSIAKLLTERMGGSIGADYADGRLRIWVQFSA